MPILVVPPPPRGSVAAPAIPRWPEKKSVDVDVYGVDFASFVGGAGDTLASCGVSVIPASLPGLAASGAVTVAGTVASVTLLGGVPGQDHLVMFVGVTSAGRVREHDTRLFVAADGLSGAPAASASLLAQASASAAALSGSLGAVSVALGNETTRATEVEASMAAAAATESSLRASQIGTVAAAIASERVRALAAEDAFISGTGMLSIEGGALQGLLAITAAATLVGAVAGVAPPTLLSAQDNIILSAPPGTLFQMDDATPLHVQIRVRNKDLVHAATILPSPGSEFDALGIGAAVTLPPGETADIIRTAPTQWYT